MFVHYIQYTRSCYIFNVFFAIVSEIIDRIEIIEGLIYN